LTPTRVLLAGRAAARSGGALAIAFIALTPTFVGLGRVVTTGREMPFSACAPRVYAQKAAGCAMSDAAALDLDDDDDASVDRPLRAAAARSSATESSGRLHVARLRPASTPMTTRAQRSVARMLKVVDFCCS
jgi:hypothetical protein